ncbi:MAG: EAL domain-containing protein [Bacillota bacterium]
MIIETVLLISVGVIALLSSVASFPYSTDRRTKRANSYTVAALMLWSFAQSLSSNASDKVLAEIFLRAAYAGVITIFPFIFAYLRSIIGEADKWNIWQRSLLYLPAAALVVAYGVATPLGGGAYVIDYLPYGWTLISVHLGIWNYLIEVHQIAFMVASVALLWRWGRKSADPKVKKQSWTLITTFALAFFLGTLHHMVDLYLDVDLPVLLPAYCAIPVIGIMVSIRRYDMMVPSAVLEEETMLRASARTNIFKYTSILFFAGAVINLLAQHVLYQETQVGSVLTLSVFLAVLGLFVALVGRMKVEWDKEFLLAAILSAVIPYLMLRFIPYGGLTVWAVPLVVMVFCLLFNQYTILLGVCVSSFFTELVLWISVPSVIVNIDMADHIVRLSLIVLAVACAYYVNNVYVRRIRENFFQIGMQKLIADISHLLVSVTGETLEDRLYQILGSCGGFFGADRSYIVLFDEDRAQIERFLQWAKPGAPSAGKEIASISGVEIREWIAALEQNDRVKIPDVGRLPSFSREKAQLQAHRIGAMMLAAIKPQNKLSGFIGFDASAPMKQWRLQSAEFLSIIANTIADALIKVRSQERIVHIAYHDLLTGLPNRMLFGERLARQIELYPQSGGVLAVAFIDLDSFKSVNDTMGHDLGDLMLCEIAQALTDCVDVGSMVARFGGDEFVLMLCSKDMDRLQQTLESIMHIFDKSFALKGQDFFVNASAGVSVFPEDGTNADMLIKNADIAMYHAKASGKKQYAFCSGSMKDEVLEQMRLTNLLYRAQEKNELMLYYQPQIQLETGSIVGVEALCRWRLPDGTMVPPSVFIPLAEQTGLINGIGEWVLREACRSKLRWNSMGFESMRISVNLSLLQLRNPALVPQVRSILDETGLKPETLDLEVTESIASSQCEGYVDTLEHLKALGVTISIDDFGTEYSSLSRLRALPIDRIKMDMQFVRDIEGTDKDKAIAKIIINLAKSLDLRVVAEGVETETQLNFLSERMCDEVQGYFYFRPMPAEELEKILRSYGGAVKR